MLHLTKLSFAVSLALFAQPDAKIANGVYWTNFWLDLASKLIG